MFDYQNQIYNLNVGETVKQVPTNPTEESSSWEANNNR
jgi:hypothetical protein